MLNKSRIILKTLTSETTSCSLCLDKDKNNNFFFSFNDEIYLKSHAIQVSDLLLSILGIEIREVGISKLICEKCLTSSINIYNFLEMCRGNLELVKNVVNSLCKTIKDMEKPKKCDSSYIYFDYNNYDSNMFYQNKELDCCSNEQLTEMSLETKTQPKKKLRSVKKRKEYKCKLCLKHFPQSQNLRAHYLRVHAPKTFKCNDCPKMFGANMLLEQHRLGSHVPSVCQQCGKLFNNRHTLRQHEKSHGVKLICSDCGRVYKREATFKQHIQSNICSQTSRKTQTDAIFCCDSCGKKYCSKSTLRVHIQFEHGNGRAFVCEWCNKRFSAQSLLKAHLVKHTQEKNFECNLCYGKFVSKESLLYHIRSHNGVKPYKCENCECKFVSASRRSEHVKKIHNQAQVCRKCFQDTLNSTH